MNEEDIEKDLLNNNSKLSLINKAKKVCWDDLDKIYKIMCFCSTAICLIIFIMVILEAVSQK
jgi:hypothetical protein